MNVFVVCALLSISSYKVNGQQPILIGNGKIILGVDPSGALKAPYVGGVLGMPATDPRDLGTVVMRTGAEGVEGQFTGNEVGNDNEGWGVGVLPSMLSVFTNPDREGKTTELVSFEGVEGGDEAKSVVTDNVTRAIRVTHEFEPSDDSEYVMETEIEICNQGTTDWTNTIYRRMSDWDIDPTPFNETVSIFGTQNAEYLIDSAENWECFVKPFTPCTALDPSRQKQDFFQAGPTDLAAMFTFDFGPLEAGDCVEFKMFYGVAPGLLAAVQALEDVEAEIVSLGQQAAMRDTGLPWTFFVGYADVGGDELNLLELILEALGIVDGASESADGGSVSA